MNKVADQASDGLAQIKALLSTLPANSPFRAALAAMIANAEKDMAATAAAAKNVVNAEAGEQ